MSLDVAKVHHIRTSGETDAALARKYRVTVTTIRRARLGLTHASNPSTPENLRLRRVLRQIAAGAAEPHDGFTYEEIARIADEALGTSIVTDNGGAGP